MQKAADATSVRCVGRAVSAVEFCIDGARRNAKTLRCETYHLCLSGGWMGACDYPEYGINRPAGTLEEDFVESHPSRHHLRDLVLAGHGLFLTDFLQYVGR